MTRYGGDLKSWNKKEIQKETAFALRDKFGLDLLEASIFARRGITDGGELLYYLEDNANGRRR